MALEEMGWEWGGGSLKAAALEAQSLDVLTRHFRIKFILCWIEVAGTLASGHSHCTTVSTALRTKSLSLLK